MKPINCKGMILLFLLPLASFSQNNEELQKMYNEDQNARSVKNINWAVVGKEDSARRKRVYELINAGKVITGIDYFNTAMIFQHGRDSVDYAMAVKQMKKAIELDSTVNRWLLAAAIDRELMSRNKPQIYGTQYMMKMPDGKWQRYAIDSTVITDSVRKYYGVETLPEQLEKVRNMNLLSVNDYYIESKSLNKTIEFIKKQKAVGTASVYNVSEAGINDFGYELLRTGRGDEALQIFTLNTQLYPNGYNTFDSLGECLLFLGRKKEGVEAYKKSLALNPKNENAKIFISANQ
ncbi:MAG: hypothetical protein QM726_21740 [Chitinophagaceae bacterium]